MICAAIQSWCSNSFSVSFLLTSFTFCFVSFLLTDLAVYLAFAKPPRASHFEARSLALRRKLIGRLLSNLEVIGESLHGHNVIIGHSFNVFFGIIGWKIIENG